MRLASRLRAVVSVVALAGAVVVAAAVPASAATTVLKDLAWSAPEVDATGGAASNTLTFTVNYLPSLRYVKVGLVSPTGAMFEPQYSIGFDRDSIGSPMWARLISSDGVSAKYQADFPVPKFAPGDTAQWKVTAVGDAELPPSITYGFTAKSVPDTTAPGLDSITAADSAYLTNDGPQTASYTLKLTESGAGVKRIAITATGPGGVIAKRVIGPPPPSKPLPSPIRLSLPIPSGMVGTWTITKVELVDMLDNVRVLDALSEAPVAFTDNADIAISEAGFTPNPVDNWRSDQHVAFTAKLASASPITKVVPTVSAPCVAAEPVLAGSGVTIDVTIPKGVYSCDMSGLAVYDQAGHVSVGGPRHHATPFAVLSRMAGSGPELRGVTVNATTVNWRAWNTIHVTLDVHSWGPGVTGAKVGIGGTEKTVAVESLLDGKVVVPVDVQVTDIGRTELQVSARIWDAAGIEASPSAPIPSIKVDYPEGLGAFVPTGPGRLWDSRVSWPRALGPGQSIKLSPVGPSEMTAAVLNVTVVNPSASSFLTVWPAGLPRPTASSLNYTAGQTVSNLVTVPVGPDRRVEFYNHAGDTDIAVDVVGYYVNGTYSSWERPALQFGVWPQTRAWDSRNSGGPLPHGTERVVDLGDVGRTSPKAVVLNLTVTGTTAPGYVTVWGEGSRPATSNINFPAGWTGSNQVIVPVGPDGKVRVYNHGGSADVVIDVVGFYRSIPGEVTEGLLKPVTPRRLMDTRADFPLRTQYTRLLSVSDLPSNAFALVLNVTATGSTDASYLTVWPNGSYRPGTSSLNFPAGRTVPNHVTVPVVNGEALIYNHWGDTHVIVDLLGYYVR
ncbi:MAG TPA: hypothetical protein VM677_17165 [Actinokineospora sp.]|jgi:hypothetical protein|nr:hypothetical protein [Actinokineospora sp.]